jgi:hypothetical protein
LKEDLFWLSERIRKLLEESHIYTGGEIDDIMNMVIAQLEEKDTR